jgi:hypothetical protein
MIECCKNAVSELLGSGFVAERRVALIEASKALGVHLRGNEISALFNKWAGEAERLGLGPPVDGFADQGAEIDFQASFWNEHLC